MELKVILGVVTIAAIVLTIVTKTACYNCLEESYQLAVEFMSKTQFSDLLQKDEDGFYKTFFRTDLYARGVDSVAKYINLIKNRGVDDFTEEEKIKVQSAVEMSNKFLQQVHLPWFDGKKASQEKWIIAKSTDVYEDGLPHTRGSVIVLGPKNLRDNLQTLSNTLTHEKIHIYQKKYKGDVKKYLSEKRFIRARERVERDLIRANPDVDNKVYTLFNDVEIKCQYTSQYPKSISDVKNSNQYYEHPFERMVLDIIIDG